MNTKPTPRLRCLHYLPEIRFEAGGVVRAVIDLVQRLIVSDVDVTLLTHDATDCPPDWVAGKNPSIRVVTVDPPALGGFALSRAQKDALQDIVAQHDVLHLHTPWCVPNRLLAKLAIAQSKPYLVTLHGMLDDWCMTQRAAKKKIFLGLFGRSVLEGAAFVHCTATGEQDQSHKWYPQGTPIVLPLIVDLTPFETPPSPNASRSSFDYLGREGIKLLFLSRIHVKKGLERLLLACGELERRGVSFQLGIAGPGEDAYVQQMKGLARQEGIAERCHFLGMVRGETKLSLYAASDLFVLPTSQENFGLVFPESLLCGTPVITTRGVDIWKELQEAGGVIVEPTRKELADAIQPLAEQGPEHLAELGQRGRQYVLNWLDPQRIVEQYRSAYRDAISATPGI